MCICLSGGGEKHHAAGAAVVVLSYRRTQNVAVACAAETRSPWGRSIGRMKAKVAIRSTLLAAIFPVKRRSIYLGQQAIYMGRDVIVWLKMVK